MPLDLTFPAWRRERIEEKYSSMSKNDQKFSELEYMGLMAALARDIKYWDERGQPDYGSKSFREDHFPSLLRAYEKLFYLKDKIVQK